jgi:hypothetical protein
MLHARGSMTAAFPLDAGVYPRLRRSWAGNEARGRRPRGLHFSQRPSLLTANWGEPRMTSQKKIAST